MAVEDLAPRIGFLKSTNDLSARQFCCVIVDTVNDLSVIIGTTGAQILGILQNKPKAGQAADVQTNFVSKAVFSNTVTRGDVLKVDSTNGTLITATTGNIGVAKALESGVAGDVR